MRMFVLILAALTAVKLWHRDETYRAAADQAVVAAYLAQASAACQKIRFVAISDQLGHARAIAAFGGQHPAVSPVLASRQRAMDIALQGATSGSRIWRTDGRRCLRLRFERRSGDHRTYLIGRF
jgi:hypothetical protein